MDKRIKYLRVLSDAVDRCPEDTVQDRDTLVDALLLTAATVIMARTSLCYSAQEALRLAGAARSAMDQAAQECRN